MERLPWFPDDGIEPMRAAFEQIMAEHGLEKVIPVIGTEAIGTKVYDLLPEMIFTLSDGEKVTLAELEKNYEGYVHVAARDGGTGRCSTGCASPVS